MSLIFKESWVEITLQDVSFAPNVENRYGACTAQKTENTEKHGPADPLTRVCLNPPCNRILAALLRLGLDASEHVILTFGAHASAVKLRFKDSEPCLIFLLYRYRVELSSPWALEQCGGSVVLSGARARTSVRTQQGGALCVNAIENVPETRLGLTVICDFSIDS